MVGSVNRGSRGTWFWPLWAVFVETSSRCMLLSEWPWCYDYYCRYYAGERLYCHSIDQLFATPGSNIATENRDAGAVIAAASHRQLLYPLLALLQRTLGRTYSLLLEHVTVPMPAQPETAGRDWLPELISRPTDNRWMYNLRLWALSRRVVVMMRNQWMNERVVPACTWSRCCLATDATAVAAPTAARIFVWRTMWIMND